MSKRFFTADFHFGMSLLCNKEIMKQDVRPFKSVEKMDAALLRTCNQRAKVYTKAIPMVDNAGNQRYEYNCIFDEYGNIMVDPANMKPVVTKKPIIKNVIVDKDTIIHVGDVACYKNDRDNAGMIINPQQFIQQINANFINIKGNHDMNNNVKSVCTCMQTSLGKRYPNVTIGHYPSWDVHAKDTFREGWIHIHGHCHHGRNHCRHCLDTTNKVLNICVSVDLWNYQIIAEDELIQYIDEVLRLPKEKLNKIKIVGNKVVNI